MIDGGRSHCEQLISGDRIRDQEFFERGEQKSSYDFSECLFAR